MSTAVEQLRAWALCLAKQGWRVFPLRPGTKRPALHGHHGCPGTGVCRGGHQGWEQRATSDSGRITRCWAQAPFNIGLACGPSGLVVLDCDQPKPDTKMPDGWNTLGITTGEEVLTVLARRAGEPLPETYTVTTPSGGIHRYFRAPGRVRTTAGELGPLVDTRAAGGYVVAPGSVVPGGGYELYDDAEPADLPGWLVRGLAPRPSPSISAPHEIAAGRHSAYVRAALRNEAERLAAAKPGQQNRSLYIAALALGRLVAGGAVEETTVRNLLHTTMSRLPLSRPHDPWTAPAIDATIDSAFRAAAGRPRRLDDRGEAA
ncbi:bifunctional DNA primase/polymerase [Saccharopolyspora sp. CA-218241]|uniref:bifunctional DNA primase/polymerase n=1 Tax=Saccharopolyspora sp. CA-218241 TaxID=3240027 RepID=UPI003D9890DC